MSDADFKKEVLRQLKSIDQRLEAIETDMHTVKTILQIDEQIENLRTVLDSRRPIAGAIVPSARTIKEAP